MARVLLLPAFVAALTVTAGVALAGVSTSTVTPAPAAPGTAAPMPASVSSVTALRSAQAGSNRTAASQLGSGAATTAGPRTGGATPPCHAAPAPGGDWPAYGHDEANTRTQAAEHTIGSAQAGSLAAAWVFSLASTGDTGQFNSTPVIAGGCAFVTASNGGVYAVDVATGRLIWRTVLSAPNPGLGGAMVGGVALTADAVVALVNQTGDGTTGPYAVGLDRATGALKWKSRPLATGSGYYTNATPQVFNGVVFAGFSPAEGDPTGQGGFVLLDAGSGATLVRTPTISPAHQAQGFAGGGIWSTPAFDPGTHYAYVGAGNPYSKQVEDVHTNAILKVDLDRHRPTFGAIVASYKGNVDQYTQTLQALSQTPVCTVSTGLPDPLDDPACGQLDLDFGSSPSLFTAGGRPLVGDLQKSGVFHVADAGSMDPVWATTVGATCQACNAASSAVDAGGVFGVSTPGGLMFSLAQTDGSTRWAAPIADGVHYEGTSVADGVVYTLDSAGFLDAFDESTGAPLLRHPVSADAQAPIAALTSAGIAIADHTVFVPATAEAQSVGYLVAYRLPA